MHNSQHFLDPYTFAHLLHGVLFYGVLWVLFQGRIPEVRSFVALCIEAAWEVLENTDAVIESYRESTISLNYYGDTILNSTADVLAFAPGYAAASAVAVWVSAAGFVVIELVLMLSIRDSLLLNMLVLLHPIDAIKAWQMG